MKAEDVSERSACKYVGIARSTYRYTSQKQDDDRLRERLKELAYEHRRFGYRRLHVLLQREGIEVNHKRVYRLYKEEGLEVRQRKKKRVSRREREPLTEPDKPNQRWSMDFMADQLADGRRFRTLNIVDDSTRECLGIRVARSIPGEHVAEALDRVLRDRGKPDSIVVDNGPEFTSRALDAWAYEKDITLDFIQPGKPIQNAFVESFNGKFRDECLNEHWFLGIKDARKIIDDWRRAYNQQRPHSSLDYATPAEHAASLSL